MKETEIQSAICDYLAVKGLFFWRNNNVPVSQIRNGQRVFRAMPKHSMHGVPDIILIRNGQFIGIEVKAEKGVMSQHQEEFKRLCEKHGGIYIIARSVEDVIHNLKQLEIPKES